MDFPRLAWPVGFHCHKYYRTCTEKPLRNNNNKRDFTEENKSTNGRETHARFSASSVARRGKAGDSVVGFPTLGTGVGWPPRQGWAPCWNKKYELEEPSGHIQERFRGLSLSPAQPRPAQCLCSYLENLTKWQKPHRPVPGCHTTLKELVLK